ncbi:hypothetical protein C5B85_01870 [Pseudoclavibacter sp. AY1F1]|uniref:hypothetical protein n=1 Tax=Pseudoclavibacter sp. AY1F1 TaxID=2080583 RepID=UPI000CE91332|nr:hypothetical protein [Pseudoclavibacter sp. AY1F1]PPF47047.1 hypothetical protein C5B85_01870 [Pseudoclavibacter sp. AY1F1]
MNPPPLDIEPPARGVRYRLRNTGDVTLTQVTMQEASRGFVKLRPQDATLGPGASLEFVYSPGQGGRAGELLVSWSTQPTPVPLRLPEPLS